MNRAKIKNYAPQARRDFLQAVTDRAAFHGLTEKRIEPVTVQGDVALIAGRAFPREVGEKRKALQERVERDGFGPTMEALAYTWFNRLVAIRYMELHGYLDHGYRVLGNPDPAKTMPEILEHAEHVELPGLNRDRVIELKLDGSKEAELYRMLLVAQCNALHSAMPFLFERIGDETELVLPESPLHSDSIVRKLVSGIDEEDWREVEVIGWLYEAYVSERYEAVIGSVVASADIPAATQRFTPKWIVRYLVQNTLGRLWLATYPQSPLKGQMRYYIEPAEQTPEVQEQLRAITPTSLNPEEITFLDPACGSAHILVEAYDLFKAIYQERGYRARDIPRLILGKNLFGLEIDDRAAQLAAFALMMKARADDRRIFEQEVQPLVRALVQTEGMVADDVIEALDFEQFEEPPFPGGLFKTADEPLDKRRRMGPSSAESSMAIDTLVDSFQHSKTFGSIIHINPLLRSRLSQIEERCLEVVARSHEIYSRIASKFLPLIDQAKILAGNFDCVVANPPYMGLKYYNTLLRDFANEHYEDSKGDLSACFIQRNVAFAKPNGFVGMITNPNWMFLSSFEKVRRLILTKQTIDTFVHNGRGIFGSDFGSCAFVLRNTNLFSYKGKFRRLFDKHGSVSSVEEIENRFHIASTFSPNNSDFLRVPGTPIAYWLGGLENFAKGTLAMIASSGGRFKTHNDEKFVRLWWEVCSDIGYWKRYLKGGEYRKYYGNEYHVVDWRPAA